MRYPASEKAEIIKLVEGSHLSAKATLMKLGIPRATFYRWYDRYREGGPEALADHRSRPDRVWNRIPDGVRQRIIQLALDEPALSPRELAVRFTDMESYFVSEASVYRLLKARDLIASPAFIVIKAAEAFKDKTTAPNQLWQTDFTYLKVIGWGWFYLSTVLDDFSRYIVAWKLCTSMRAEDVTATLDRALRASDLDQAKPTDRPRLLSDNGSSYIAGDLAKWLNDRNIKHLRGAPYHPMTQGKIRRPLAKRCSTFAFGSYPWPLPRPRRSTTHPSILAGRGNAHWCKPAYPRTEPGYQGKSVKAKHHKLALDPDGFPFVTARCYFSSHMNGCRTKPFVRYITPDQGSVG